MAPPALESPERGKGVVQLNSAELVEQNPHAAAAGATYSASGTVSAVIVDD